MGLSSLWQSFRRAVLLEFQSFAGNNLMETMPIVSHPIFSRVLYAMHVVVEEGQSLSSVLDTRDYFSDLGQDPPPIDIALDMTLRIMPGEPRSVVTLFPDGTVKIDPEADKDQIVALLAAELARAGA